MSFINWQQSIAWQDMVNNWVATHIPQDPNLRHQLKVRIFRIIAIGNILLGFYYFFFRYTDSINPGALWFAVPLLIAETYSFVDTLLFILMMWQPRIRKQPVPPLGKTIDVFITTYSEPLDMVMETVTAAINITYPHQTFVLDDGGRREFEEACAKVGCGYIKRGPEWDNKPRHAKAGNVNNALMQTSGEFILMLDSDQIPSPEILDRTLGYFDDPKVAFVQTPQYFYNVPDSDPFGSQAPLFYGPIQQGKDGWNSAFFCGSNAVLRREALMSLGLKTYIDSLDTDVRKIFSRLPIKIGEKKYQLPTLSQKAANRVSTESLNSLQRIKHGNPIIEELITFQEKVQHIQQELVASDLKKINDDLAAIALLDKDNPPKNDKIGKAQIALEHKIEEIDDSLLASLSLPLPCIGLDEKSWQKLQLDNGEALDVQPLATISITEDMVTAMRLHGAGWQSVYHHEILAIGLAPDDLGSMLGQRYRWGAGTIQALMLENPLTKKGLSWPQRLQYFTTMYSYFSGFAAVIYLIAPIIYLFTGIAPVTSFSDEFLWRIVPYLLLNKILFKFVAWGINVKRGEQYSLALFPVWIKCVTSVFAGQKLSFKVTPKTRQTGVFLNLVMPQLIFVIVLIIAAIYGTTSLLVGWYNDTTGVLVNVFWAGYDIVLLSAILQAAVYQPSSEE